MHTPDKWSIVRIFTPQHGIVDKIIAGWNGGYAQSEYWRINSGIKKIEIISETEYIAHGYSGSKYQLFKDREGFNGLTFNIFKGMEEQLADIENAWIDVLPLYRRKELNDQS